MASEARATAGPIVDIKAFIDAQPIAAFQWVPVAIGLLIVVTDGLDVAITDLIAGPSSEVIG